MIDLKPFDKSDFDRLISWIDNEALLVQFAGTIFTFPLTTEQLDRYLADKNRYAFKVINSETGEVVGHSEIYLAENKVARLCRILLGDDRTRGKGYGREIVRRLVMIAFEQLQATSIELYVYDWNKSAIRCYENVGFVINPAKNKTTAFKATEWTALNMSLDQSAFLKK